MVFFFLEIKRDRIRSLHGIHAKSLWKLWSSDTHATEPQKAESTLNKGVYIILSEFSLDYES